MKEEKEDVVYSIVAPVYNEKDVLPEFCARVTAVMKAMGKPYEIILVNDGSKDGSLEVLKDLSKKDGRIKAISFSRNFGHQIALTAGMDCSGGRAVILMDSDLQHPPELVPKMAEQWEEGCEEIGRASCRERV